MVCAFNTIHACSFSLVSNPKSCFWSFAYNLQDVGVETSPFIYFQGKEKIDHTPIPLKEKRSSPEYYESSASHSESGSTRSSGQRTPPSSLSKAVDR
jgi:hypothetical protein